MPKWETAFATSRIFEYMLPLVSTRMPMDTGVSSLEKCLRTSDQTLRSSSATWCSMPLAVSARTLSG